MVSISQLHLGWGRDRLKFAQLFDRYLSSDLWNCCHIPKSAEPSDHRIKWTAICYPNTLAFGGIFGVPQKTSEIIWKMIGGPAKSNEFFRSSIKFLSTTQQFDPMSITLPKTNIPLKMMVSNRNLLFQWSIFEGYVSFREGILVGKNDEIPSTSGLKMFLHIIIPGHPFKSHSWNSSLAFG